MIAQSASNALRAIGENVDEDFVILLPSAEGWRVGAFAMCFPSGLKLAEKLGWKMTSVQTSGTQKLDSSFDRLLTKLSPGAAHGMSRMNWSIARTQELFTPSGSHCYEGEEEPSNAKITVEECALRVERQTLWKLPGTGAVVFGIKTYTYPLSQIKTEDNGAEAQRLALAIESLGEDMGHFRAGSVWGDQVLSYLRS